MVGQGGSDTKLELQEPCQLVFVDEIRFYSHITDMIIFFGDH